MEGLESLFKQTVLVVQYSTVIDFRCIKLRDRIEIVLCDQFQINQVIRADQQRLSGKGRKALVGAVPVARRADGEYLPVGLLCSRKEIDEGKGFICLLYTSPSPRD